jgi:hypothetical protein
VELDGALQEYDLVPLPFLAAAPFHFDLKFHPLRRDSFHRRNIETPLRIFHPYVSYGNHPYLRHFRPALPVLLTSTE